MAVPLDWPPARDGMRMTEATPDLKAVTQIQQKVWADGDFAKIGNRAQIVGEHLCETVDLLSVERVLDVACGSGNTANYNVPFISNEQNVFRTFNRKALGV